MRIGIYARVSTKDQQSTPMQIANLKEYARLREWDVVRVYAEKESGASDRRPKHSELMREARQRKFDAVLVWKLDRWGRDLRNIVNSLHELQQLGVSFISFKESIDMTTSHGRAMASMIAVFAAFEREQLTERVKAGVAEAKRKGIQIGRPTKIDEKIVKKAHKLHESGYTYAKIMEELKIGRGTVYKILGNSSAKKGRPVRFEAQKYFASSFKNILSNLIQKKINLVQEIPRVFEEKYLDNRYRNSLIAKDKPKKKRTIKKENTVIDDKIVTIKLVLRDIRPQIWREIKAKASTTLHELHYYIQASLGWEAFHLHKFYTYDEDEDITLMQLIHRNNKEFLYEYDFGDNWQIDIKIGFSKEQKRLLKPVCTAGARAAPPEDCGGIYGYYQILRTMRQRKTKSYKGQLTCGVKFEPNKFDKRKVNKDLQEWVKSLKESEQ